MARSDARARTPRVPAGCRTDRTAIARWRIGGHALNFRLLWYVTNYVYESTNTCAVTSATTSHCRPDSLKSFAGDSRGRGDAGQLGDLDAEGVHLGQREAGDVESCELREQIPRHSARSAALVWTRWCTRIARPGPRRGLLGLWPRHPPRTCAVLVLSSCLLVCVFLSLFPCLYFLSCLQIRPMTIKPSTLVTIIMPVHGRGIRSRGRVSRPRDVRLYLTIVHVYLANS
jgi:hypothetical protein